MKFCLFLFLFITVFGCLEKQPAIPKQQGLSFLFYPLPNVYYDQDNWQYYHFDSTTSQWQKTTHLPVGIDPSLGRSVALTDVPVPVYSKNAEHRLVHGSVLYSSPEDLREKYRKDSAAALSKKDTVAAPKQEEKKKRKVREWLRKVFKKK